MRERGRERCLMLCDNDFLLEELQNSYHYVIDVTETRGLEIKQQISIVIRRLATSRTARSIYYQNNTHLKFLSVVQTSSPVDGYITSLQIEHKHKIT